MTNVGRQQRLGLMKRWIEILMQRIVYIRNHHFCAVLSDVCKVGKF